MKKNYFILLFGLFLYGCTVTPNKDGSTTIDLNYNVFSKEEKLKSKPEVQSQKASECALSGANAVRSSYIYEPEKKIQDTSLNEIFKQKNLSGSKKSFYPKVAITIKDCIADRLGISSFWIVDAVIWHSETKSETLKNISVNASKRYHSGMHGLLFLSGDFEKQIQEKNNTGAQRTNGPKPPLQAYNADGNIYDDYSYFIMKLIGITGWQQEKEITMWIVGLKK